MRPTRQRGRCGTRRLEGLGGGGHRGHRAGDERSAAKPDGVAGPAISQDAFEVGDEVRAVFVAAQPQAASAFIPGQQGKWLADIYALARLRLNALGITQIYGGDYCTYRERERFFSSVSYTHLRAHE